MNNHNGLRFKFGRNWKNYAKSVNEQQIESATESLRSSLSRQDLSGLRVLDAGCGSGLFSLAACRLGAREVVAFDYDTDSVSCAIDLNNRYGSYTNWATKQGDVLDQGFLKTLGQFDIVYSWGVLHHTGDMWKAIENVCTLVSPGGLLFISIYNDQGWISRVWHSVKRTYNRGGLIIKFALVSLYMAYFLSMRTLRGIIRLEHPRDWYRPSGRGMNTWHDAVDWIGGYPFETAKPKELEQFLTIRGLSVIHSKIKYGSGCNEFILRNKPNASHSSKKDNLR